MDNLAISCSHSSANLRILASGCTWWYKEALQAVLSSSMPSSLRGINTEFTFFSPEYFSILLNSSQAFATSPRLSLRYTLLLVVISEGVLLLLNAWQPEIVSVDRIIMFMNVFFIGFSVSTRTSLVIYSSSCIFEAGYSS